MSFARIKGQTKALERIGKALSSGRLTHSLLYTGPEGVGKRLAALETAKALLCAQGSGKRACDRCPACHRIDTGTHADLFLIEPADDRTGITVGQVRDLARRVGESPLEGERKVVVILAADTMTLPAQNCLLKTLEEPPDDTTILLVAEASQMLIPTVRSRCRMVNFSPVDPAILTEFLVRLGVDEASAKRLGGLSAGSFARARRLADGGGAKREELLEAVAAEGGPEREVIRDIIVGGGKQPLKERREEAIWTLGTLHRFLVDCMRKSAHAPISPGADMDEAAGSFARRHTFEELGELEKTVFDGIIMLSMFADIKLVTDSVVSAFAPSRLRSAS